MTQFRPVSPHLSVYFPQSSSIFSITFRVSGLFLSLFTLFISFFSLFISFFFYFLPFLNILFPFIGFLFLAFFIFHSIAFSKPNN